jgi:hypothetical protein
MHRNREHMIRMRLEWKADGYCSRCGKEPARRPGTRCARCITLDWIRNNTVVITVQVAHSSTGAA